MTPSGTKAGPEVKVGQIWRDNDKRMTNRLLRVVRIEGDYCWLCGRNYSGFDYSHQRRVKLSRMRPTSTGYVLVKEAE